MSLGKVVQIIGPVVDVQFPLNEALPDINNALHVKREDGSVNPLVMLPTTGSA